MDDTSKKSHTNDHHQPPSDEATRNKIDKHLSDIDDTISEDDIKNINTDTHSKTNTKESAKSKKGGIVGVDNKDDDSEEPEKEAPTPWEILD